MTAGRIWIFLSAVVLIVSVGWFLRHQERTAMSEPVRVLESFWPIFDTDPKSLRSAGDWVTLQNLYSGLVEQDGHNTVRADLAESWTRSHDGLTWTFQLRPNLKWSDGSTMTSEQIAQSLDRGKAGTTHTHLNEYVESISALGSDKIVFKLKSLPENFLFSLAFVDLVITHPKAQDADGKFSWEAPSSGAYIFSKIDEKSYRLTANPHHWTHGDRSIPEYLVVKAEGNSSDVKTLATGPWDASHIGPGIVTAADLATLEKKFSILTGDSDFLATVFFLKNSKTLSSLDEVWRRKLLRSLYSLLWKNSSKDRLRATGLRPSGTKGSLTFQEFDAVLGELEEGTPSAVKLNLLVQKKHVDREIVKDVVRILSEMKMTVKVTTAEPGEFRKLLKSADYDLSFEFLGASEGDPDSAWRIYNGFFYKPVATDAELLNAQQEKSPEVREEYYKKLEARAIRLGLYVPLKNEVTYIVLSDRVGLDLAKSTDWGLKLSKLRFK